MGDCQIRLFLKMIPALAAALALTGCLQGSPFPSRSYDVTSDPAWWGDLHLNEVLELNQDTLLNGVALCQKASKSTDSYDSQHLFGGSITVEMFKANPGKYWEDLHLLPKGTRFRCVKLERYFSDRGGTYELSAEIQDGEFKGKVICVEPLWGEPEKKGSLKLGPYALVHPVE